MHEQSRSYRMSDGLYYNLSHPAGKILQGPFKSAEEAIWHARVRSAMTPEEWTSPPLPSLNDLETWQNNFDPNKDAWTKPEPTEYTPAAWPEDIYTVRR